MKVVEAGSGKGDLPDGRAARDERIAEPPAEQIARPLTDLRVSPLTPAVSRKNGDSRYPIQTYAGLGAPRDRCELRAHRHREIQDSQIVRMFPERITARNPRVDLQHTDCKKLLLRLPAHPMCETSSRCCAILRDHSGPRGSFMRARNKGFLNLMRDSLKLCRQRLEQAEIDCPIRLSVYAAKWMGER